LVRKILKKFEVSSFAFLHPSGKIYPLYHTLEAQESHFVSNKLSSVFSAAAGQVFIAGDCHVFPGFSVPKIIRIGLFLIEAYNK